MRKESQVTYRIALAVVAALATTQWMTGCASSPTSATPEAPAAEVKPQARLLERSAPSQDEAELPLLAQGAKPLPVLAEGRPLEEGPARAPIAPPPTRPGSSPLIEEVTEVRTADLHGGAFPGVGTAPRPTNGTANTANAETRARLDALEKKLEEVRSAATPTEPDPALVARLNALEALVGRLEARPNAETPPDPRIDALQDQLAVLQASLQTAEEHGKRNAADTTRLRQIEEAIAALEKAPAAQPVAPATPDPRIDTLQREVDALKFALESAQSRGDRDKQGEKRLDKLEAELARLSKTPAAPAPGPQEDSRFAQLEEEIATLQTALDAKLREVPKADNDLARRFAALEARIDEAQQAARSTGAAPDRALATRIAKIEDQLNALDAALGQPTPQGVTRQEVQAQISALEARLEEARRAPIAAEPQALEALRADLAALRGEIDSLRARPASAPAPGDGGLAVAQRFDALEGQLEDLRTQLEAQRSKATDTTIRVAAQPTPNMGDYRIGAGDMLEFQSFNDEMLSREEVPVRFDGHVSLPLIPDVPVADVTRAEAEERIRAAYRAVFRDPQIALIVREATSKSYSIVGDIEAPGVYPYLASTKLIDAISKAGGLRRRNSSSSVGGFVGITGQLTKAFVIRTIDGERNVLQFDLRSLGTPGAHDSEAPIYYNDVIYIPEGVNLVYLLGESRNPVIVELTEGMKILQLLALSGGFDSSTARLSGVVLMRQIDDENTRVMKVNVREMLRGGKDIPLMAGDIVYIPRKRLVTLSEFIQRFTGTISPVLEMYTSAVDAYYAKSVQQAFLDDAQPNRTLEVLGNLESFGSSTNNIVELFRRP